MFFILCQLNLRSMASLHCKICLFGRVVHALQLTLSNYCITVDKERKREKEDGGDSDLLLLKFQFSTPEEGCST